MKEFNIDIREGEKLIYTIEVKVHYNDEEPEFSDVFEKMAEFLNIGFQDNGVQREFSMEVA